MPQVFVRRLFRLVFATLTEVATDASATTILVTHNLKTADKDGKLFVVFPLFGRTLVLVCVFFYALFIPFPEVTTDISATTILATS